MLAIENLKAKIEEKEILKGLNLIINPGEVHAIMGPNGSGKSTLSNILSGKKGYEIKGNVTFEGKNLLDLFTLKLLYIFEINVGAVTFGIPSIPKISISFPFFLRTSRIAPEIVSLDVSIW